MFIGQFRYDGNTPETTPTHFETPSAWAQLKLCPLSFWSNLVKRDAKIATSWGMGEVIWWGWRGDYYSLKRRSPSKLSLTIVVLTSQLIHVMRRFRSIFDFIWSRLSKHNSQWRDSQSIYSLAFKTTCSIIRAVSKEQLNSSLPYLLQPCPWHLRRVRHHLCVYSAFLCVRV